MRTGRPAAPRIRLNPALRAAVRAAIREGRRSWQIALLAGFPQPQCFSTRLHQQWLDGTPLTIERFGRVADIVGFPRAEVFLRGKHGGEAE